MALAVPLFRLRFTSAFVRLRRDKSARQARFTSRVGGGSAYVSLRRDGSAFFVRPLMRLSRFLISSLGAVPVLLVLYGCLTFGDYGEPGDPPVPFLWTAFLWVCISFLWPFLAYYYLISHSDPHGIHWLAVFLVAALFWGFIIELLFMVKKRLWPNQSQEPTAVAAAVASHVASRRWLSFFR